MSRAEAITHAMHMMGDAQAILDGAGADLAAAYLDLALHCARELARELEPVQVPPK